MRAILLPAVLALALLATSANADHCVTYETARPEFDSGPTPVGRWYWDNDACQPCMWSTWIYEESNGIDGLQRADEVVDGTCHGLIKGDTIIF